MAIADFMFNRRKIQIILVTKIKKIILLKNVYNQ
jgi:hypothetical protein